MTRIKRLAAPRAWNVERKVHTWAVAPSPGPHSLHECIPLLVVLRDMLGYADNAREASRVVRNRQVLVDNRPVRDPKFPVGLMDTLSLPDVEEQYRVLLDTRGRFRLIPIETADANWKLVRVEDKRALKGGRIQLNLSDGRNLLAENGHATKETLKIEVPGQEVLDAYPFQKGAVAFLVGGRNVGRTGHVEEVVVERSARPNEVRFKEGFSSILDYAFIVGKQKPVVPLPEMEGA